MKFFDVTERTERRVSTLNFLAILLLNKVAAHFVLPNFLVPLNFSLLDNEKIKLSNEEWEKRKKNNKPKN